MAQVVAFTPTVEEQKFDWFLLAACPFLLLVVPFAATRNGGIQNSQSE
jgi:hypothetical protein